MDNDIWPFQGWLRRAVLQFGLTPETFWAMSLSDWFLLTRPSEGQGCSRKRLADLIQEFPDRIDHD